jgi:hypothetical protein
MVIIVSRPKNQIVDAAKGDLGSPQPDVRVDDFRVAVQPLAFPLALAVEKLQALNRSDTFDEIRALLRAGLDGRFGAQPQNPVEGETQRRVQRQRTENHEGEQRTVDEYHREREDSHDSVDHRRDHALSQKIADRLERGEPGEDISDVPLLEERRRQADEMMKEPGSQLKVQNVLDDQQHQRSNPGGRNTHQH